MERKRDSLVSWRGRDEYDRFAEALGATLPRITDGTPESSAPTTSEGDTEYLEITETATDLAEGEKTPVERSIPRVAIIAERRMAGMMRMSAFVGRKDGKENPADFISDVEMAARICDVTYGESADGPDATKIALFRQNLDRDGDAWHWWNSVLKQEVKETFGGIKKAFMERYDVARNRTVSRFNVQNELMLLTQRPGQSIAEYVKEAEQLSERVPEDMDSMLAMLFIRGLADQESRRRLSYDLRDTPEFTFSKALHMVKSWHQEIGVPDPFNPHSVGFNDYREKPAPVYMPPGTGIATLAREEPILAKWDAGKEVAQPGSAMQEAFNQMMINFMGTMKSDFRQATHRAPGVVKSATGAVQKEAAGSPRVLVRSGFGNSVCFNCGGNGHISTGCTNTPLPYAEQRKIREDVRLEREARMAATNTNLSAGSGAIRSEGPVRAQTVPVRVVATTPETGRIMEVNSEEELEVSPVSCIKVVSVAADKAVIGQACSALMRLPAVAAIFENAMADKRVRVDDDDEYEQSSRGPKQPRMQGPTTRSAGGASSSSTRPPPQVLTDSSPEPESEEEGIQVREMPRTRIQERVQLRMPTPTVGNPPEDLPPQTGPQPAGRSKSARSSTRSSGPVPPINWMKGQKQYSLQDALNDVTPKISFPQLLDVSPRLRRELAELLRSSVPRARKKGKGKEVSSSGSVQVAVAKNSPVVHTEAHDDDEVNCLYIDAWIGDQLVGDVLVDGGAMLDLISREVADNLKLEKHVVRGLGMRLADDSLVRLNHYVWTNIIVAGVIARIKAFIVPVSVTYKVLLSRRWLKRVKGVEYHETNVMWIEGMDRIRRKVRGKPAAKEDVEVVKMIPGGDRVTELESEEAEDAIETLLHELDHWGDEGEDWEGAEEGNE